MSGPGGPAEESDLGVRPLVARAGGGIPGWMLLAAAIAAALLLFAILEARRAASRAPSVRPSVADFPDQVASTPPLIIPPEAPTEIMPNAVFLVAPERAVSRVQSATPGPAFAQRLPQYDNLPRGMPFTSASPPQDNFRTIAPAGSAIVIDNAGAGRTNPSDRQTPEQAAGRPAASSTVRARAGMLQDRSTTVVQGTLIHAVLETGFDSTRPGFARAIVSRDIRGFDGTRVLIPRGSRLIGDYQADARPGQNRALIIWNRLIRPDGATIEIGSPASDPVGRGGVKAQVNSHFLERFSGAILQSALDIGVNLASRSTDNSVIVALPNNSGLTGRVVQPSNIAPTLSVRPATSISIFVARDLDFTDVENRP